MIWGGLCGRGPGTPNFFPGQPGRYHQKGRGRRGANSLGRGPILFGATTSQPILLTRGEQCWKFPNGPTTFPAPPAGDGVVDRRGTGATQGEMYSWEMTNQKRGWVFLFFWPSVFLGLAWEDQTRHLGGPQNKNK